MKHFFPLFLGAFAITHVACAQNPSANNQIQVGKQTITWVQSVPSVSSPSAAKASAANGGSGLGGLQPRGQTPQASGLDFSRVHKGFLGIGHNAASNIYGFISEEVVVTLKPGEVNKLASLNANCKLIVENTRMYVCKADSVPHLQSLMGQLQAMPSVHSVEPQFVTQFNKPM